jgi:hypothetical protein
VSKARIRGGGPLFKKFRKLVLYRRDTLDAWLASQVRQATSDVPEAA